MYFHLYWLQWWLVSSIHRLPTSLLRTWQLDTAHQHNLLMDFFSIDSIMIRYFQWRCVLKSSLSVSKFTFHLDIQEKCAREPFFLLLTHAATVECLLSCSCWLAIAFNLNMAIIKSIICWYNKTTTKKE